MEEYNQEVPETTDVPAEPATDADVGFKESKKGIQRTGKSRRLVRRKTVKVVKSGDQEDDSSGKIPAATASLVNGGVAEADDNGIDKNSNKNNPRNADIKDNNTVKTDDSIKASVDGDSGDEDEGSGGGGFSLPPWASTLASVVKPVMGFVTDKAISFMKVTLQYVPDVDITDDEDEEEEDVEYLDAEQDSDSGSEFEDATPQIGEKDRIQHICEELMTTEEDYVRRLHILVKVKTRTTEILKPEVANQMFKDIETIYQFHYNTLLPQLQERIKYWEKYRRIGDIMKRFAPFLKLYTEYVKNFEAANTLVSQWADKSSKFSAFLKEVQTSQEHGRLKVQSHMLEPVQRVPRYELLLKDYLKRLPEDSPDRADTQEALDQVVQAASHFEAMMKRDTRIGQLMTLQNQIEGAANIVSSSRELVHKGKIMTVSAKKGKEVERFAFLFNDLLLVCSEIGLSVPGMSNKYKIKYNINLDEAQVSDGATGDQQNTLYVQTTEKIVELAFPSEKEKEKWFQMLTKFTKESTKEKLLSRGSVRVKAPKEQLETLGKQAPLMVHLSKVNQCKLCSAEFSPIRRKKHCRACGNVVCGKCSNNTALLEYDRSKPQKVCDECYVIIQESNGSALPQSYAKPRTEGVCLEKGFLQVTTDGGKSWKKRWFAIHDSHKLYSFKNAQEKNPIASISIIDYKFEMVENTMKKAAVITGTGLQRTFSVTTEDISLLNRWLSLLTAVPEGVEREATLDDAVALTVGDDYDSLSLGSDDGIVPEQQETEESQPQT